VKTLRDAMPREFLNSASAALKFADVEVVEEKEFGWPGPHKNVIFWVVLANGAAVGWNENPSIGWSFPLISKYTKMVQK
jgi:hypothetical protein